MTQGCRPRRTATRAMQAWCLLLLGLPAGGAAAEELKLVVGSWCPFECMEQEAGGAKGFVTDIAVAVLSAHGMQPVLMYASFHRGIELVRENSAQVLIGTSKEDAPDLIYPEVEQGLTSTAFFVRAGEPWRYRGIESLDSLKSIGVMQDFDYGELNAVIAGQPLKFIALPAVLRKDRSHAQHTLEKLLGGRVDAILHDPFVIAFHLQKLGKPGAVIEAGALLKRQPIFVAFSPQLPDARRYADLLSRGTQALRASGELARILARYGLQDWATP